jgi:3,4-dihydroxy 2-butanone 4-phosphate synthase/GTP cyclohydrolase II
MVVSLAARVRTAWAVLRGRGAARRAATAKLPTRYGDFTIHVYESARDRQTHVALVRGDIGEGEDVLVRVHSCCLTGDVFGSARCDCGPQLDTAMDLIATEQRGILLYLNQEGRGIGLANKIRAYALQDQGYDPVEANERLGFRADHRDYGTAVEIFRDLGVRSIRLLSNNPRKFDGLTSDGIVAVSERVPLEIPASEHTRRYLSTKKEKLGHLLSSV